MSTETFVYVVGPNIGPQKIGIARNVKIRLDTLQVGCPFDLRIHLKQPCVSELHARKVEVMAHRILSHAKQRGEWFNVTPERAVEVVRTAHVGLDDGVEAPAERLVIMRARGVLSWDHYESAMAYFELIEAGSESDYVRGGRRGGGVERKARARAILRRLNEEIDRRAGPHCRDVLVRVVTHGVDPSANEKPDLLSALDVVEAQLEAATSSEKLRKQA